MTLKASLPSVTLFTAYDPYTFESDNVPLKQLSSRDDLLADTLDKRVQIIDITGAATPVINSGPTDWVVTRNGVGDYTIVHSLNNTSVKVIGTCYSATPLVLFQYASTSDSSSVRIVSLSGVVTDCRFFCHLAG